ncbi:MAG TPA: methyltransferase domain-containing protein [Candidatus Deferrimicrobiaceae bacterium]|nr:methyltransferase domain-containing protein [Candidatus Deferrimicrobiaceae bacterium]
MSDQERWQVAGDAASTYERALVPALFATWAPLVVALGSPAEGARVLDVACGTGVVARLAARQVGPTGTVVGLDLNPRMLAVAAAASGAPGRAPITWREAPAMPLPDSAFDVVYCQAGLQFFPDRPAALREMHRVLVAGGRLGLMVWRGIRHSPGFDALAVALEQHVSAEAAAVMRAPFGLSEAAVLHTLIAEAGFHDVSIQARTEAVRFPSAARFVQDQVAGSPLAAHVARASAGARADLIGAVARALDAYQGDGALTFPIEAHLASARK